MINLIYDERGSGKTKRLLTLAERENAIVLTQNAEALRVKARAYDLGNVEIYDVCIEPQVLKGRKVMFHNLDRMLEEFYGCEFVGATMTRE